MEFMKKITLIGLFILGVMFVSEAQGQDGTKKEDNSGTGKFELGINLGGAQLNSKFGFGADLIYGLKYKKHFFGFNYSNFSRSYLDNNFSFKNSELTFMTFGYTQGYDIIHQEKNKVQLTASVAYSEFGLQDVNSSTFFHSGNMYNISNFVTLSPGINFTHGILNFNVQYRYSLGTRSSNYYNAAMINGLSASLGIKFAIKD
jgi:hypothetical protein